MKLKELVNKIDNDVEANNAECLSRATYPLDVIPELIIEIE